MKNISPFLFATLALAFAAGCVTPRAKKAAVEQQQQAAAKTTADEDAAKVPDIDVEEVSLRGKDFQPIEGLNPIGFDYDSAALKEPQLEILKKNAEYLKAHSDLEVLVAGFCDDRGTTEYNLALGQKRAKEVRDYYIRLGISGKSLATISYGKENPVCAEQTEKCWAESRRAETRIRIRVSANLTQ